MDIYQYDTPGGYRFRLVGKLENGWNTELGHAWKTASSTLRGRPLVVDIAAVSAFDAAGLELLLEMQRSGARLVASEAPQCIPLARELGLIAVAPRTPRPGAGLFQRIRQWFSSKPELTAES